MEWRDESGIRWLEAELPGAKAAFTTRGGGHSQGNFASLNLGLLTEDDPAIVHGNRKAVLAAISFEPESILSGRQVHEAEVRRQDDALDPSPWLRGSDANPASVDGWATSGEGLVPLVYVADCLPVALAGPKGVAMIHCGWRGLAAGIVEAGVREVSATAAAIGPGIGRCCFEVGDEVLGKFSGLGHDVANGRMLDLPLVAYRLLQEAGVEEIELAELCTRCEEELFFSHRRDGAATGRQAGMVWACPS